MFPLSHKAAFVTCTSTILQHGCLVCVKNGGPVSEQRGAGLRQQGIRSHKHLVVRSRLFATPRDLESLLNRALGFGYWMLRALGCRVWAWAVSEYGFGMLWLCSSIPAIGAVLRRGRGKERERERARELHIPTLHLQSFRSGRRRKPVCAHLGGAVHQKRLACSRA